MDKVYKILVINPGSTSTKIGLFDNSTLLFDENITHSQEELKPFAHVKDQIGFRSEKIEEFLKAKDIDINTIDAVIGRAGMIRRCESGIYEMDDDILYDAVNADKYWGKMHPGSLGIVISNEIGKKFDIPAYAADPVTVDEFPPIARISGVPDITRTSMMHTLNLRKVARQVAKELGRDYYDTNLIGVHLGGGITIAAIEKGKFVDNNNGLMGQGPFSPQRAGALPIGDLLKIAFSGEYQPKELVKKLSKQSGLMGYLGTDNARDVQAMIADGNKEAELVYKAMAYQIAKEVGGCATVLKGDIDGIFITGGIANDKRFLVKWIKESIEFLGKIFVIPGEMELEALAESACLVLDGKEKAKNYSEIIKKYE